MLEKALDYLVGIVTENEEVKKFPKDFVTASMQWIRKWFLIDDPVTTSIVENPALPEAVKKPVIEAKLNTLKDNPDFMKELEERLKTFEVQKIKQKGVVENSNIEVQGNVHIGDTGASSSMDIDQKNIVKGSTIKAGGDFRLGDDVIANNQQVNITHNYYTKTIAAHARSNAAQNLDKIQQHIAEGNTRKAIDALLDKPDLEPTQQTQVLMLSGRLSQLDRQVNMGIIEHSNASIERARINNAVLSLLGELKD
jgi:hypothetical protein